MWLYNFSRAAFLGCVSSPLDAGDVSFLSSFSDPKNVIFYMGFRFVFDKCLLNFSCEPVTVSDDFKRTCLHY